ncbi:MAG: hypothetical protein ACLSAP_04805 [Oscillospiraceae bacterium]
MSKDPRKITVAEVARRMGKAETYVRACLIDGRLPFGAAVKRPGSTKWSFHIPREAFEQYMRGIKQPIPIPTPAQPASLPQELPEQPEREQPAAHGAQVIVLYNWPPIRLPAS